MTPRLLALNVTNTDNVGVTSPNANYAFIQATRPSDYAITAINVFLGLAGVASFIYLLLGGVQWITAGGDKDAVEKARRKITQSLIGLAIVFSAYAIMFILRTFFNIDLVGFGIAPLGTP